MNNLKAEWTLTAKRIEELLKDDLHDRNLSPRARSDLAEALIELQSLRSQSLSTQQPMGEVRVKPLEWVGEEGVPGMDIRAEATPEMHYTVRHLATNTFDVILDTDIRSKWFRDEGEVHTSYESAKDAAEADYQNRILSSLHPNQESGE